MGVEKGVDDIARLVFLAVVCVFLLLVAFNLKLFDAVPFEGWVAICAVLVFVGIGLYLKYAPVRKLMAPNRRSSYYIKRVAQQMMEDGRPIPMVISETGKMFFPPGFQDSVLGNYYWAGWKEDDPHMGRIFMNVFYSIANDAITTSIPADTLHFRPKDRLSVATGIVEMIERGQKPPKFIMPNQVNYNVNQDTAPAQPENGRG